MDENRHVRKSNLFVEGRYRFGVNEQKILLTIISKISINDKEFKAYRLNWSQLKKITNNQINTAKKLNDACEKLKNKTVLLKKGNAYHGFGFLSGWTYEPSKYVEFRIDPCMKELLLDLLEDGRFTLYKLECILSLSSTYSIRLYEILKSHHWKGTVDIPLADLKWSLGVPEDAKSMNRFDNFRRFVLDKSQKDFEKHTDIKFTYKKLVQGRLVVGVQFKIAENKKYQTTLASFSVKRGLLARNGDKVLLGGKEYVIEGDCIRLSDGPMPIGTVNKKIKQGQIEKL